VNLALKGNRHDCHIPSLKGGHYSPLEVIHTDSCHVPVPSIKGFKDFVTFTDEATRMSFVYYLPNKKQSTFLEIFEIFKEGVKLHFYSKGYKIKSVRMEGGSEYQATLKRLLVEKEIETDIITHYSPESNGISERLHRTLLDMARTMLFGANMPNKLWAQAISTAIYLKNRLPRSSLRGNVTPHEMWFGTKPSLSRLRVFGCASHVHVPEERRKKYADRKVSHHSIHTYFVGYDKSDAIYEIWNPSNDNIDRARHVIFDETLYYQDEGDLNTPPIVSELEPPSSAVPGIPAAPSAASVIDPPQYLPVSPSLPLAIQPTVLTGPYWPIAPLPPVTESRQSTSSPSVQCSTNQVVSSYSLSSKGFPPNAEALLSHGEFSIPDNYLEIMRSPDRDLWLKARKEEYDALINNKTWTLIPRPSDIPIDNSL
jgi:hypothetical protein